MFHTSLVLSHAKISTVAPKNANYSKYNLRNIYLSLCLKDLKWYKNIIEKWDQKNMLDMFCNLWILLESLLDMLWALKADMIKLSVSTEGKGG